LGDRGYRYDASPGFNSTARSIYDAAPAAKRPPTHRFLPAKNHFEFRINYKVPLQPGDPDPDNGGNGAWALTKNWFVGAYKTGLAATAGRVAHFTSGEYLKNGRYYAQFRDNNNVSTEVELPLNGTTPARPTGNTLPNGRFNVIERDGSLMYGYANGTNTVQISKSVLTGFDSLGNPVRAPFATVATANYSPSTEVSPVSSSGGWLYGGWGYYASMYPSTGGVYPVYAANPQGCDSIGAPHLAGVSANETHFIFQVMPEANMSVPDFKGSFPCRAGYGSHAGGSTVAEGHHIITLYDGQYATFGEFFTDYWDDGLLVQEFGKSSPAPLSGSQQTGGYLATDVPGDGGNIAFATTVVVDGILYVYHPSEAAVKVQRWHFDTSHVHEYQATGLLGSSVKLTKMF
jgi:hypothetical protein